MSKENKKYIPKNKMSEAKIWNCEPCGVQFASIGPPFCWRCKLMAMFEIEDEFPW